jgi:hypothetical protein
MEPCVHLNLRTDPASSKTRKITSLVCMRPIVDSVVAAAAMSDGAPYQVTTLARANTGVSA